jgi:hypothetical protein
MKSPSLCMATFRASFTNLMTLWHHSHYSTCYTSRRTLASPLLWLQKCNGLRAQDLPHSPYLWHEPRLANVTCAWSWRLYGINPAILLQNMIMQLTDVTASTSWFRVISGYQCYAETHCLHLQGSSIRFQTKVITRMMQLLDRHVMKRGIRRLSRRIRHSCPTEVTPIYLCLHQQWLSLICHIFSTSYPTWSIHVALKKNGSYCDFSHFRFTLPTDPHQVPSPLPSPVIMTHRFPYYSST